MRTKTAALFLPLLLLAGYAVALASETYVPPPESVKPPRELVQGIYAAKCAKCHPLSRPDDAKKNFAEWKSTVERMRGKDPAWISADQADKIARFLAGKNLVTAKCNKCHADNRADVAKTVVQWKTTLDRMQGKDPAWFNNEEKGLIEFFLTDIYLLELD